MRWSTWWGSIGRERMEQTLNPSRNVLMISCAFPPTGGPGVQRSLKFAKFLPQFGWRPIVWCAGPLAGLPRDDTLRAELPDDVSIHTHAHRPMTKPRGFLADFARRAAGRLGRSSRPKNVDAPHQDEFITWADSSMEPLLELIEREQVSAIYSTFSPASNHCLAMALKTQTGLPWLADFRDLWTDDYRYPKASAARCEADRELERRFLTMADVVIGVTPRQTKILAGAAGPNARTFETITNGFDAEDFSAGAIATTPTSEFVLAHVGRLDQYRSYDALFDGLKRFLNNLGQDRSRFLFRVVGHAGSVARAKLQDAGVRCDYVDYVEHARAIHAMRSADALLLTVPTGPNAGSVIPAKLFEYLAAQRPILTVGPNGGACERIVAQTQAGLSAGVEADQIAAAIDRMYSASRKGQPMPGCLPQCLAPFERKTLTWRLADLLDRTVATTEPVAHDAPEAAKETLLCSP